MSTGTQTKIVPLLSSGTAGPLGAIHLPRLWLKLSLENAGALPEGYDFCGHGFDQMTIDALGLDRDDVISFIRTNKPTYMEFEEWVVDNGKIDKDAIAKHNAAIRAYNHADELAADMRDASGIRNEAICDAVMLNTVEDLDEVHRQIHGK